ncbi:MAG: branched-chain amino acid transport system ATP-binding protein [Nocardioidaceae bacterium]|jgi:branched-chain amino acid transport system ATP-binding protein|nr:branched-chain amino acid transport system ATP-binding protein [Nocardioidaceae bacterium]
MRLTGIARFEQQPIEGGDAVGVQDVVVSFKGVRALDGVTASLAPGEVLGIIGPNGSGKTTLLNVLSGFVKPDSGAVLHRGRDVTRLAPRQLSRRGIGRTFQAVRLFKNLTVEENLVCAVLGHGATLRRAKERSGELLDQLELGPLGQTLARALPYGDQRRVALARTLALRPSVLLLDEPAAGLNDAETDELLGFIKAAQADLRCSVMFVEHDMRVILQLCDRIQVLDSGKTIAVGTPEQIRHDPLVISAYLGSQAV